MSREKQTGQPQKTELSNQLINAIINYLVTRPFAEVNQLLGAIDSEVREKGK